MRSSATGIKIAVVGGGAGGVELACAMMYRMTEERHAAGMDAPVEVTLVSKGPILHTFPAYMRRTALPLLKVGWVVCVYGWQECSGVRVGRFSKCRASDCYQSEGP